MKKILIFLSLIISFGVSAQKKITVWEGEPFSPGVWSSSDMRFSDNEGLHFPTLPDSVYFKYGTLIFDIDHASYDATIRVMNGWWSATYQDNVHVSIPELKVDITPEMANDCAQGGTVRISISCF